VTIKVLEVNFEKNQIALTMKVGDSAKKTDATEKRKRPPREKAKPPAPKVPSTPNLAIETRGDGASVINTAALKAAREAARPAVPNTGLANSVKKPAPQSSKPVKPREQFTNNPFASLAGLKGTLKR